MSQRWPSFPPRVSFPRRRESSSFNQLWTPAFVGVTRFLTFYETINFDNMKTCANVSTRADSVICLTYSNKRLSFWSQTGNSYDHYMAILTTTIYGSWSNRSQFVYGKGVRAWYFCLILPASCQGWDMYLSPFAREIKQMDNIGNPLFWINSLKRAWPQDVVVL